MGSSTAAVGPAGCGPRCWGRTTGSCPRPALSSGSPQLPHHGTRCCWLARPLQAAVVSALSFTVGAALPLTLIVLAPIGVRVPVTALAALALLALLGAIGARIGRVASQLGQAARLLGAGRAALRVTIGGGLAMGLTALIGQLVGATGL
jgi:VIT1/CCC1 family predicted Fe2+/Mn2+ transporter